MAGEPRQGRAQIEIVTAPTVVPPGEEFELVVRVTNAGAAPWLATPERPLALDIDSRLAAAGSEGGWEFAPSGLPLLDYLPGGLSTVARLRVRAPHREGRLSIRPVVHQAGERFPGDVGTATVAVATGARALEGPPRPRPPAGALRESLRAADGLLRARLQGHSGLSRRYERWRSRVKRLLR
jgi:hypothetical protein